MKLQVRKFFLSPQLWQVLTPLLLIVPNIALAFTEQMPVLAKLANIVLPAGLWLWLCACTKRIGVVMLCLIPVYVLCAFQIVLLYLYGESIIAIDMFMNVVTTNVSEATELLGNLKIALVTVIVLYLPPIAIGVYLCIKHRHTLGQNRLMQRVVGYVCLVAGFMLLIGACYTSRRVIPDRVIFPYNVSSNVVTATNRIIEARNYHQTSHNFTYHAQSTRPDSLREVYVFVIGETSRADNWSLFGYKRLTNPKLSQREGLYSFNRTLSQINTTHKSVPMLMSCLDAENFGDSVAQVRSIFEAYNTSGFQTTFISNQRRNHSYIDFYGMEAKNVHFLTDDGKEHSDESLVAELRKVLDTREKNKLFVILHTYGSHFEYNKRYPANERFFRPDGRSEASRLNRNQLLNAYDNSIRYTDNILDSVITLLDSLHCPSAMLYVSDHGEDIFDDNRERFLHASPVATYWQLHVPLILWMSPSLKEMERSMSAAAAVNSSRRVSSSRAVFHTLLHISGLTSPWLNPTEAITSMSYNPRPFLYLNDYNEALPLEESGLRIQDFRMLEKNNLLDRAY